MLGAPVLRLPPILYLEALRVEAVAAAAVVVVGEVDEGEEGTSSRKVVHTTIQTLATLELGFWR